MGFCEQGIRQSKGQDIGRSGDQRIRRLGDHRGQEIRGSGDQRITRIRKFEDRDVRGYGNHKVLEIMGSDHNIPKGTNI